MLKSFFETQWWIRGNAFPGKGTYAEDNQTVYVPEMFGPQRKEFLRKFVKAPLENGQPLMGAVWSVIPGDPKARGFGKSTLMGEEAKLINADFGLSALTTLDVSEDEARQNPVLASYVSFNTKANDGIASIDAASFHLVRFLLRSQGTCGAKVLQLLRERAAARLVQEGKAVAGQEKDAIVREVKARFRTLAVSIDIHNLLAEYLDHLASGETDALDNFLSSKVTAWHHNRNGLKYLQIFVVFAELADIQHFTFFVDQVEDFTSESQPAKIRKNVKIIRDALLESEPFASRASFVFQLHGDAYKRLRDAWTHEDLQDLNWNSPLNEPFIVMLTGLDNAESAILLTERCLNHASIALPGRKPGIWPFTEASVRKVWQATKPRPRAFLRSMNLLMQLAKDARAATIDERFVNPKLEGLIARVEEDEDEDQMATDSRLS
jgi:hypothetical protein